jgi:hypothetical protein
MITELQTKRRISLQHQLLVEAEVQADDEDERGRQVQIHTEWPMIRHHEMM